MKIVASLVVSALVGISSIALAESGAKTGSAPADAAHAQKCEDIKTKEECKKAEKSHNCTWHEDAAAKTASCVEKKTDAKK